MKNITMKKMFAVVALIASTSGFVFAQSRGGYRGMHRGGRMGMMGSHMGMMGGMGMMRGSHMGMMGGMGSCCGYGGRSIAATDEAGMRAQMLSYGMSEADVTRSIALYKEQAALIQKYEEARIVSEMKAAGMSDADIQRSLQLQRESANIYQKYETMR